MVSDALGAELDRDLVEFERELTLRQMIVGIAKGSVKIDTLTKQDFTLINHRPQRRRLLNRLEPPFMGKANLPRRPARTVNAPDATTPERPHVL